MAKKKIVRLNFCTFNLQPTTYNTWCWLLVVGRRLTDAGQFRLDGNGKTEFDHSGFGIDGKAAEVDIFNVGRSFKNADLSGKDGKACRGRRKTDVSRRRLITYAPVRYFWMGIFFKEFENV